MSTSLPFASIAFHHCVGPSVGLLLYVRAPIARETRDGRYRPLNFTPGITLDLLPERLPASVCEHTFRVRKPKPTELGGDLAKDADDLSTDWERLALKGIYPLVLQEPSLQ